MAPVGGTMWAASPARKSRPNRSGSATKLRSGAMLFSMRRAGRHRSATSGGRRARTSSKKRSSDQSSTFSSSAHLDIVAAARRRAHGRQGEAALVVGVDEFVIRRRHVGEEAEPAEGIGPFIGDEPLPLHGPARDAVKAVAADDDIAADRMGVSLVPVSDGWPDPEMPLDRDIGGGIDRGGAAPGRAPPPDRG